MRFSSIFIAAVALSVVAAADITAVERRQATATGPAIQSSAGSFVYAACAVEPFYNGIQARTLHGASQINSNMTVDMCASYCAGFKYFGVEYADGKM